MQKTFKIFGIIALIAVIGFIMAACSKDDPGDPKFITITDIPSEYDGKYGALMLSNKPNSANYSVYSMETISGTSFTFSLLNWNNDSHPWTGDGKYSITLFIFENLVAVDTGKYLYAGVIAEEKITEITTTIAWSSFIKKSVNFQFKR